MREKNLGESLLQGLGVPIEMCAGARIEIDVDGRIEVYAKYLPEGLEPVWQSFDIHAEPSGVIGF